MAERATEGRPVTAVDIHAHYLGPDLPTSGGLAPHLVVDESGHGRIIRGGTVLREATSALWDVEERLRAMDRAGVSHQVISPVPVIMEHAWSTDPAYARAVNDSIVAACASSGGRLFGFGCLPTIGAASEVQRCRAMGLRGVEIGTRMGEHDLDAPELDPVWAACERTGACVFVHPVAGGRGVVRRAGPVLDLGMGMLADTALGASALVFGRVLERYPGLRVALAHGCGAFPWAYPRLRLGAELAGQGSPATWDALVRRLYADTVVLDPEHLRLLAHRFGVDRLLLGSDSPFLPGQHAVGLVDEAITSGAVPPAARADLLMHNAFEYLGL